MIIPAIKTPIDCTRSPIIWITAALIFIASPDPPKQPCEWPWPLSSWLWPWPPGTPWECPWPEPIRIKPRTRLKKIAATEIPIIISGLISSSWSINLSIAEYTNIPVIIFINDFQSLNSNEKPFENDWFLSQFEIITIKLLSTSMHR